MQNEPISIADPRLSTLSAKLRSLEEGLGPTPEAAEDGTQAAVSVVLRGGEDLELLLIKRAEAEGDPWSGQMALPGGRRDPSDATLLETAVRETAEETSVRLDERGIPLGRLGPLSPATTRLPPITIFPFVFGVPENTHAKVTSREVDEIHWVPLEAMRDPGANSTVEIHYGDNSSRVFPCWRVYDRVVWGLTYRILTGFLQVIEAGRPVR